MSDTMSDTMSETILLTVENGVARIVLNRPDVGNAVDLPMARALLAAAVACEADRAVRCVVMTGAGRLFCAGGDIGVMGSAGDRLPAVLAELIATLHAAVTRLARMQKPLLVLVNGPCGGAGFSLAVAGDIVLAARSATYTAAYGAVGLTVDGGLSWSLPRLVGLRKAQEIILTNRRIGPDEAEAIGLVTRVVEDAELAGEGAAMATRLAHAATAAIGATRTLLHDSFESGFETQLDRELRSMTAAAARPDAREGVAAFLERRKPDFGGV